MLAGMKCKCAQQAKIDIIEFEPCLASDFRRLNIEWLQRYFVIEPADELVLNKPVETIIEPGGAILFARVGGGVVGTCALITEPDNPGHFELAKMAVTHVYQAQGIGRRLLHAALDKYKVLGGTHLHLETSSKLPIAIQLYSSVGFRQVDRRGGPSIYARADVYMTYFPQ